MPKLLPVTELVRTTQAIDALALYLDPDHRDETDERKRHYTIEECCEQVGISVHQFYRWIQRDPEGIVQLRTFMTENRRMELAMLTAVNGAATQELIGRLFNPMSTSGEVLAIKKYFDERLEALQDAASVRENDQAAAFLTGPRLEAVDSRLNPSTTVEVKKDGTVNVTVHPAPTVIDATANEPRGSIVDRAAADSYEAREWNAGTQESHFSRNARSAPLASGTDGTDPDSSATAQS